jgi:hypothetical protein
VVAVIACGASLLPETIDGHQVINGGIGGIGGIGVEEYERIADALVASHPYLLRSERTTRPKRSERPILHSWPS